MELNRKLQELRKQRGLTQEELARALYVSRTAVSKWESGRGYPSLDSLREIARFFSLTVDELLSGDELLAVAERAQRQEKKRFCDLVYGLLDLGALLLLFLPFFALRTGDTVEQASLLALGHIPTYLKVAYFVLVIAMAVTGVALLALQDCRAMLWQRSKIGLSFALHLALVLLLIVSRQPYAAVFVFLLLAIKTLVLIRSR
ncbi:MAG: helix-turn-helix transcriptional regulator [Clostridia bacterium]|nr:helix-turn-helix transcriptional regulator [Clostridia bacterium]